MRETAWRLAAVVALGVAADAQTRDITVEGMRTEKRVALVIGNGGYAAPDDFENCSTTRVIWPPPCGRSASTWSR
jgi:hypothetical protein